MIGATSLPDQHIAEAKLELECVASELLERLHYDAKVAEARFRSAPTAAGWRDLVRLRAAWFLASRIGPPVVEISARAVEP